MDFPVSHGVDNISLAHLRSDYDFTRTLGNVMPNTFPRVHTKKSFNSSLPPE